MDLRDREFDTAETAAYLAAYMALPFPVCIHDRHRIVLANPAAAFTVRATPDDLIGAPVHSLLHPDCVDASLARSEIETTTGQVQPSVVVKLNATDGSSRSHHVRNWRIRGGDAPLLGAAILPRGLELPSAVMNASRAMPSDDALQRIVRLTLDTLPVPICIHDMETVLFINHEACRLVGATDRGSIERRPVSDFVHPDGSTAGRERRRVVLQHGSALRGVPVKLVSVSGEPVYETVSAFPLDVDHRRLVLVVFAPRPDIG